MLFATLWLPIYPLFYNVVSLFHKGPHLLSSMSNMCSNLLFIILEKNDTVAPFLHYSETRLSRWLHSNVEWWCLRGAVFCADSFNYLLIYSFSTSSLFGQKNMLQLHGDQPHGEKDDKRMQSGEKSSYAVRPPNVNIISSYFTSFAFNTVQTLTNEMDRHKNYTNISRKLFGTEGLQIADLNIVASWMGTIPVQGMLGINDWEGRLVLWWTLNYTWVPLLKKEIVTIKSAWADWSQYSGFGLRKQTFYCSAPWRTQRTIRMSF